jgi:hypothetical protein
VATVHYNNMLAAIAQHISPRVQSSCLSVSYQLKESALDFLRAVSLHDEYWMQARETELDNVRQ